MNFLIGEVLFERVVVFFLECRVCSERFGGLLPCEGGEFRIFERFHHQVRDAGLADAGEFAAAAGVKVFLGEGEAVVDACEGFETVQRLFIFTVGDGIAVGLVLTAYDPAADLVQLSKSEAFSVQDGDDGGVGDVHPDFHDRGADEDVDVAAAEPFHHFLFFIRFHSAVKDAALKVGKDAFCEVFVFFFH